MPESDWMLFDAEPYRKRNLAFILLADISGGEPRLSSDIAFYEEEVNACLRMFRLIPTQSQSHKKQ